VLDLAKCLHINLKPEDMAIAHCTKKSSIQLRLIIIRFTNFYARNRLHRNRTKVRKIEVGRLIERVNSLYQ